MLFPPPPQSNIHTELIEKTVLVRRVVKKSSELLTNESNVYQFSTYEYAELQERKAIRDFLDKHHLVLSLDLAKAHIKKHFPRSVIKEELYSTGVEEATKMLYLTILTDKMSSREVFDKNRQLFKGWALAKDTKFNRYINITAQAI